MINSGHYTEAEAVSFLRKSVNAYSQGEYSLDLLDGYDRLVRILSATGDTAARNASAYAYWQTFERMDIIDVYYKMFSYQNEIIRSKEAEKRMERQGGSCGCSSPWPSRS